MTDDDQSSNLPAIGHNVSFYSFKFLSDHCAEKQIDWLLVNK